jgi:hypothetical protein
MAGRVPAGGQDGIGDGDARRTTMMLTESAREAVTEVNEWATINQSFLQAIWEAFAPDAQWPIAPQLTRALFGRGSKLDVARIARNMPGELGHLEPADGSIKLRVRALAHVTGARPLCELFLRVVRHLVDEYGRADGEPVIDSATFEDVFAIDRAEAARLEELCLAEGCVTLAQGGDSGSIRFAFSEATLFYVADVKEIDDYLGTIRELRRGG